MINYLRHYLLLLCICPAIYINLFGETTMTNKTEASFGHWQSPISAAQVASGMVRVMELYADNDNVYWSELRPANQGRSTIVKRSTDGSTIDITPPDFDVRTRVHEYGSGAFTVNNDIVYASKGSDARIYEIIPGKEPRPITPSNTEETHARFADFEVTSLGIFAVGEMHQNNVVKNFIALINPETGTWKTITEGYDFYSNPILSPDKKKLAWVCWNHPNMPWTNNELWVADLNDQAEISHLTKIAGELPESISQPKWHIDGSLYFISDRNNGWWNLHKHQNGQVTSLYPMAAEITYPQWFFKMSTWAFLNDNEIIFGYNKDGWWQLAHINLETLAFKNIGEKSSYLSNIRSSNQSVVFLEFQSHKIKELKIIDSQHQISLLTHFDRINIDEEYLSKPVHLAFPSEQRTAYGFYYPPCNKDFKAPENEKPPLIVISHGGPTAQSSASYSQEVQYWTTRGFGILDVNYGGSTGYGRDYRSALDRNWGIVDVEDCVNGALYLAEKGLVDPDRLIIRGGSAGGYTTLAALAFKDVFKAGASYYGVADLEALAKDTHKFESRYLEQLVGKYPEEKELWMVRSPINSVEKISCPLIIFQGEKDPIVPQNQALMIYEALKKRGVSTEIHIYEGEEHGFRKAKNIINSLEREVEFYQKVFANY